MLKAISLLAAGFITGVAALTVFDEKEKRKRDAEKVKDIFGDDIDEPTVKEIISILGDKLDTLYQNISDIKPFVNPSPITEDVFIVRTHDGLSKHTSKVEDYIPKEGTSIDKDDINIADDDTEEEIASLIQKLKDIGITSDIKEEAFMKSFKEYFEDNNIKSDIDKDK